MFRFFAQHRIATGVGVIALTFGAFLWFSHAGFQAAHYEVKVQIAMVDSRFDRRYQGVDELLELLNLHARPHWLEANVKTSEEKFRAAFESYQAGVTAREKSRHLAELESATNRIQQLGEKWLEQRTSRTVVTAVHQLRAYDSIHNDQLTSYHLRVDDYNFRVSRLPGLIFGGEPVSRLYPAQLEDFAVAQR
jgi:hypothetical protein